MFRPVASALALAPRVAAKAPAVAATAARALPCASAAAAPRRWLNVHEYAGMELMREYDVTTPRTKVATTPAEAEEAFASFGPPGSTDVVIKAQVLAGGRGLGSFKNGFQGGVHMCTRPSQAKEYASQMLGQDLVTKQTGAEGKPCSKVLLCERMYMRRELYFSILMDRAYSGPVMVASPQGGTSIEEVAEKTPEAIFTEPVDIETGPTDEALTRLARNMGFGTDELIEQAKAVMGNLYKLFINTDATLVEINPLAETPDGKVVVCDAKLNFDDNAAYRHPDIFALRDESQEDPREVSASKYDLNYIGLDGTIGCMVNGAGLAMATMDIIKLHGGDPANFLDVGGGATADQVEKAFEILNDDAQVKAILVNIFGGIMRCDVIAQGILQAAGKISLKKPIVLRLAGTNVKEAKALIDASGYRMIVADDLDVAAAKAVKIADIVTAAEQINMDVSFELPL